jgi:hypothetical protein
MPKDPFDKEQWHNFGTYGIHLMEHTWHRGSNPLRRRAFDFWRARRERELRAEISRRSTPTPRPFSTVEA